MVRGTDVLAPDESGDRLTFKIVSTRAWKSRRSLLYQPSDRSDRPLVTS
jgi:hypothetical protein